MTLPDYALSVGINHYPGLTPLQGAEADAQAFAEWVTREGGVLPVNAMLILSSQFPQEAEVTKARPASQEVWSFFEQLRGAAAINNNNGLGLVAGRRLYLFFSGHGFSYTLDASCVLMANAERDTPHSVSAKAWADRLYENGYFEEILLFQDACREPVSDVELTPPYLKKSPMAGFNGRKRFYAFAAKSPLLALEKEIEGRTHGVFSATLMAGLSGGARDPQTGQINTQQLKSYLVSNMAARLEAAELANEDISQRPEVFDPDPFVIVPAIAPATGADAVLQSKFPVRVQLAPPGGGAQIFDSARKLVDSAPVGINEWNAELPLGLFELVMPGRSGVVFKVSGALDSTGQPEVVHVS